MKFKVGDRVRLTRKALHNKCASPTRNEVFGGEVNNIDKDGYYTVVGFEDDYLGQSLELVPEEPEFEYGEEIDVYSYYDKSWVKAIFISKIPGNVGCKHACVTPSTEEKFKTGETFEVQLWRTARKPCLQITRKEIAEKLGISEDFVLIDDINQDEI